MLDQGFLRAADAYYHSERAAMFVNLAIGVAVLALVVAVWATQRDAFARGFLLSGVLVALVVGGSSLFILNRDPGRHAALAAAADQRASIEAESARIGTVMANFGSARIGVTLLGVGALIAMLAFRSGMVRGCAAGALLFVLLQIVIDYYSEARAGRYAELLKSA